MNNDDRAKFEALRAEAIEHAKYLEGFFVSEDVTARRATNIAKVLRALASARAASAEPVAATYELSAGGPEVNNPCSVCGVLRSRHGTYPTCASHHYSPITTPAPAVAPAAQSAETAWANLPAALKAHPGIKALYRAALASQKGA